MKLEKYVQVEGVLRWEGGRIGGQKESVGIAEATENPIIRHPITGVPYIPGSSLKGKIRSQLELSTEKERIKAIEKELSEHSKKEPQDKKSREYGDWEKIKKSLEGHKRNILNGEPCGCGLDNCVICRAFGPHKNTEHSLGPTRLIFRDAKMVEKSDEIKNIIGLPEDSYTLEDIKKHSLEKGLPYAELKSENIINRHTGRASDPRTMERVISGSLFKFEIDIRVFEGDEQNGKNPVIELLKKGLKLLEKDYLGGSGSRGYGKVKFYDMKIDGKPWVEFNQ